MRMKQQNYAWHPCKNRRQIPNFHLKGPNLLTLMTNQAQNLSQPSVELLSPEGLLQNPAFSQVAVVNGAARTVYIGGQNAVNAQGEVIGKGDLRKQTEQMLRNLETALTAAGAGFEHVIKWNVFLLQGQSPQPAFEVVQQQVLSKLSKPPLITMVYVAGLAHPDYLAEIEAVAVIP